MVMRIRSLYFAPLEVKVTGIEMKRMPCGKACQLIRRCEEQVIYLNNVENKDEEYVFPIFFPCCIRFSI